MSDNGDSSRMLNDDRLCVNSPERQPHSEDIVKSVVICVICSLVIGGNILCLVVLGSRRSRGFILDTTRILMTSLACTDCGMGILVMSLCIYPALFRCWPFGQPVCKLQALFISSLFHESTLSLVLIAVDRYISIFHPLRYPLIVTRTNVIITVVITWLLCFSVYGTVVFGFGQYYFDEVGINCEPYYQNTSVTATVMCLFYFPPAIIITVCYLQIFRVAVEQRARISTESGFQEHLSAVRLLHLKATKTLGLVTLGFFIAVTPWTISQLIMAVAKIHIPLLLDFSFTWLALSNSFWNVIIYFATNHSFRIAVRRLCCRSGDAALYGSRHPSEHAQTASRADLQTIQKSSTTPSPSLQIRHMSNGVLTNCSSDVVSDVIVSQKDDVMQMVSVPRKQYFCVCDQNGHSLRTVMCSEIQVAPSLNSTSVDGQDISVSATCSRHCNDNVLANKHTTASSVTNSVVKHFMTRDILCSSSLCPPESVELRLFKSIKDEVVQNGSSDLTSLKVNMKIPCLNDSSTRIISLQDGLSKCSEVVENGSSDLTSLKVNMKIPCLNDSSTRIISLQDGLSKSSPHH